MNRLAKTAQRYINLIPGGVQLVLRLSWRHKVKGKIVLIYSHSRNLLSRQQQQPLDKGRETGYTVGALDGANGATAATEASASPPQ